MNKEEIKELAEVIKDSGVCTQGITDKVREVFSDMASDINCNLVDQIDFLVGQGFTRQQIIDLE